MAVTITNTTVSALNANQGMTANASSAAAGATDVFTFTPTKKGSKIALIMSDASTAALAKYSYSIAAGDLWAGKAITGTAGSTAGASRMEILTLDTARVLQDDGTIAITFTPGATDKALGADHHLSVYAVELL